jgi:uncharacterized protein (TIGR02646 family)
MHRARPNADYDNYADKDTLRKQLFCEQRGICCFCGGKIRDDPQGMKIAHWLPQASHPHNQLDYWNLLGACRGNEGQSLENQHCDTHQGNALLSKNPANPTHHVDVIVSYLTDGSVVSSDRIFNTELGEKRPRGDFDEGVLNLNLAILRHNRIAALDAFKSTLQKRSHLNRIQWAKLLIDWRGDPPTQLEAFAPVVAYWIRKKLARP